MHLKLDEHLYEAGIPTNMYLGGEKLHTGDEVRLKSGALAIIEGKNGIFNVRTIDGAQNLINPSHRITGIVRKYSSYTRGDSVGKNRWGRSFLVVE